MIYGLPNCDATRDARRFFREYDIPVRFVDLSISPLDGSDLSNFLSTFPLSALIDSDSTVYAALAAKRDRVPDSELLSQIRVAPSLLRLPLIRSGSRLALGDDEDRWEIIAAGISSKG